MDGAESLVMKVEATPLTADVLTLAVGLWDVEEAAVRRPPEMERPVLSPMTPTAPPALVSPRSLLFP